MSRMYRVPRVLKLTEVRSGSSNLTVAAEWKTMDTSCVRVSRSLLEMPNPGRVMSPAMATTLFSWLGLSSRIRSNAYKQWKTLVEGIDKPGKTVPTFELISSLKRLRGSTPLLLRKRTYIFWTSSHERSNFSTKTYFRRKMWKRCDRSS